MDNIEIEEKIQELLRHQDFDNEEVAQGLITLAAEIYIKNNISSHFLKDCQYELKEKTKEARGVWG